MLYLIRQGSQMIKDNGSGRFIRSLREIFRRTVSAALCSGVLLSGCSTTEKARVSDLQYLCEGSGRSSYRGHNTAIEHPCLDNVTAEAVQVSDEPRTLQRRVEDEVREITLQECIRIAGRNNEVIEQEAFGGVGAQLVLSSPEGADTIYDAAIQETGVLFGRRGLNAALAEFDTNFSTGLTWGRGINRLNTLGTPIATAETANFTSGLNKSFATGASVSVFNDWSYTGTNLDNALFPSAYRGSVGAEVRQPLLAGSGVDFTRIAGPVNPSFGSIAGVSQGVVIARINQDITLADFELAIRNGVRTIENAYWDLYGAYRVYDTAVVAYESAFQTWREAQTRFEVGTLKPADELQARDRLYETRAQVELSLSNLFRAESYLRVVLGMPMNDGTVMRPIDEPVMAEFKPDWKSCIVDGLTNRTELRRQKWQIKSLQLQLTAARSLVRPRLDAVGSYGMNAFGDQLGSQSVFGSNAAPVNSALGSLTHDGLESWTMGFQMSMPIGFRQARSQVRNYELQLARANAILASQEKRVAHDIAVAMQEMSAAWTAAQTNSHRMKAAAERVELLEAEREVGTTTLDLVLRAQASVATAEASYYQQVVQYMKSIANLNLATGRLLEVHGIYLAEGMWTPAAYEDAAMRASERRNAIDNPHLDTEPHEFASPGPPGTVELRTPVRQAVPRAPEPLESEETEAVEETVE
jgi:outer membrane protein TolC